MTQTTLTSEAKEALRKSVRALRARLIDRLGEAAKGEYRLDLPPRRPSSPRRAAAGARGSTRGSTSRSGARASPRTRSPARARPPSCASGALEQAVKEAAHTLLNRLVLVRILEHHGLLAPRGRDRRLGAARPTSRSSRTTPARSRSDDTRGYGRSSTRSSPSSPSELPGLFGRVGSRRSFRSRRRRCARWSRR